MKKTISLLALALPLVFAVGCGGNGTVHLPTGTMDVVPFNSGIALRDPVSGQTHTLDEVSQLIPTNGPLTLRQSDGTTFTVNHLPSRGGRPTMDDMVTCGGHTVRFSLSRGGTDTMNAWIDQNQQPIGVSIQYFSADAENLFWQREPKFTLSETNAENMAIVTAALVKHDMGL